MRFLVVSDIHANLSALRAVLEAAPPHDELLCLGDIVGYGTQPNECCDLLRGRGALCLLGNHDAAAVGHSIIEKFKTSAQLSARWTADVLTSDNRAFLSSLSPYQKFEEWDFEAVHASLDLPLEGYIQGRYSSAKTFEIMQTELCFFGHTHFAAVLEQLDVAGQRFRFQEHSWKDGGRFSVQREGWKTLVNPGSVGQQRDGSSLARFGMFDGETREVEVFAVDLGR